MSLHSSSCVPHALDRRGYSTHLSKHYAGQPSRPLKLLLQTPCGMTVHTKMHKQNARLEVTYRNRTKTQPTESKSNKVGQNATISILNSLDVKTSRCSIIPELVQLSQISARTAKASAA